MQAAGWLLAILLVLSIGGVRAGPMRKQRAHERNRESRPLPAPPPAQPISAAAVERAALREQIAAMKASFDGRGVGDLSSATGGPEAQLTHGS